MQNLFSPGRPGLRSAARRAQPALPRPPALAPRPVRRVRRQRPLQRRPRRLPRCPEVEQPARRWTAGCSHVRTGEPRGPGGGGARGGRGAAAGAGGPAGADPGRAGRRTGSGPVSREDGSGSGSLVLTWDPGCARRGERRADVHGDFEGQRRAGGALRGRGRGARVGGCPPGCPRPGSVWPPRGGSVSLHGCGSLWPPGDSEDAELVKAGADDGQVPDGAASDVEVVEGHRRRSHAGSDGARERRSGASQRYWRAVGRGAS